MQKTSNESRRYRFFEDPGHGWLEVPRREVVASGARISRYSYYNPDTDMVYLEEDCDALSFLEAIGAKPETVGKTVWSSMPRRLPAYNPADFIDGHVSVIRPDTSGKLPAESH